MDEKTNEVVDETPSSGHEGGLSRGIPRDRRGGERECQNEVKLVLVQALVPLSEVDILLSEQRAFLVDGSTHPKSFEESRPIVVSPSRHGIVPEHPGHPPPNDSRKVLEEVSLDRSLINGLALA